MEGLYIHHSRFANPTSPRLTGDLLCTLGTTYVRLLSFLSYM